MNDRLQFRHHSPIFNSRERAIDYIFKDIKNAASGITRDDETLKYSLFSEPAVLRYKNDEDDNKIIEITSKGEVIYNPNETAPNPHIILAIGADTNNTQSFNENRYCIIDIDKTEQEIADLWEFIKGALKGLSIITKDSNTLKLYNEKTEDGTIISGDVVVAESQIFNDRRRPNTLLNTKDGLFTFVKLEFTPGDDKFTFIVNDETTEVPLYDYYVVDGYYNRKDESLHLIRKDGEQVVISLENLVGEWTTEGDASTTPIVLKKEEIKYGDEAQHHHVEPFQDILRADVRIDSGRTYNILNKTNDGRYLYVDGTASNITYFKDGKAISVQEALKDATKNASNDSTNIIYEKVDGFYATAQLKYKSKENKLIFTTSNSTGGTTVEEFNLSTVDVVEDIYYNPSTETLVIKYIDGSGEIKTVDIPIGDMITEWDIQNEGHNVKLHKERVIAGNDKVSADVKIYNDTDNILVDKNHELFVKGTADNIKYGKNGNVSNELDKLNANDADINARLNETSGKVDTLRVEFDTEVERAEAAEEELNGKLDAEITRSKGKDTEHDREILAIKDTIGTGFTTDGHETVTYKFNELSDKADTISAKTDSNTATIGLLSAKVEAEVVRAKGEEQRIEKKFDDELGDGFNIRNTVRDEFNKEKSERIGEDVKLQTEIDALSASTSGKLIDVINIDHSIDVDKTDAVRPVIKVNLSKEVEDDKANIIKLNADGLYAGVDLSYEFNEEVGTNQLIFKTTNGTKIFDLKTNSVVDKIYYDPTREAVIIEYTVDGKRMPDVVVPVHDLINEWRVSESTIGAIKLSKTRESGSTQDVLSAETIIATHEDNILINDDGALYVSRKPITDLENRMNSVEGRLDVTEADIDALEDGLSAEITRATGEEQRIEGKLDREIERSNTKDNEHDTKINELRTDLGAEIENRRNADDELNRAIHAEEDRAKTVESAITQQLNAETAARQNADATLDQKIDSEILTERNARISKDNDLQQQITNESNRAIGEEQRIEIKLDREIERSNTKDEDLQTQISNEVIVRTEKDGDLQIAITDEAARAKGREDQIENNLNLEIQRAQDEESNLKVLIDTEKETRETEDAHIWRVIRPIEFFDTTTIHNERVRNSGADPDEVRHSVIVANTPENIIKVSDIKGGLYATVSIGYNESANALTIYDGVGQERKIINTVTLGPGSLIKDISYDHTEKVLVVTYRRAGESEDTTVKFPVADLFNEWDVQNPSEKSAIELHKEDQSTETGTVDIIWGRVLITDDRNGDGKPDEGSDNIIEIRNNGLYVSGSAITEAIDIAECAQHELKEVETAVLGHKVNQECGSGFTYSPKESACFISAATDMYDADVILDKYLCSAHTRITNVEEDVDCLWREVNITQENVIGFTVPPCGINADGTPFKYPKHIDSCFISAATNMNEADVILDRKLCEVAGGFECISAETEMVEDVLGVKGQCDKIINYPTTQGCLLSTATTFANADAILEEAVCSLIRQSFNGSERVTTSTKVEQDPYVADNKMVVVDVRLSHGNDSGKWQEDEDLIITSYSGDCIEETIGEEPTCNQSEFTDTNVLRIVDLTGLGYREEAKFNGLYLSNVWNCGLYTRNGVGTPYDKYQTDEAATAMNYYDRKYRNGVRYHNGQ